MTYARDVAKRRNIIIPNPSLIELKALGHQLIDEMVATGVKRDTVYEMLSARMRVSQFNAHFGKMYTKARVYQAIGLLEDSVEKRKIALKSRQEKVSKRVAKRLLNQLSFAKQKEFYEKRRIEMKLAALPWYRKMFYNIINWKNDTKTSTT